MRKDFVEIVCPNCDKRFKTKETRQKFCGKPCAAQYNNTGRKPTEEHKKKVSESLKQHYAEHPEKIRKGPKAALAVAKYTKGKYNKNPSNIFNMNSKLEISGESFTMDNPP